MFKKFDWSILFRVIFLFIILCIAAFVFVKGMYIYEVFIIPVVAYLLVDFYKFHKKAQKEVEQFVEAVHYRDFTRYFDETNGPLELKPLRKGFNEITSTFKVISKEKETQYQYLQKILELVDTGILSYDMEGGEVVWMNDSLKKLLQIPYLKTIQSLDKRDNHLCAQIIDLKPGESIISTIHSGRATLKVLLSATAFQTEGRKYKLLAFQNVNEALDETESKAWQKLLSVMTHEIMNSVAPISSLADTLKYRLQESVAHLDNSDGAVDDLEIGINTIKRRSEGLLKFTETYRSLNKITTLNLTKVYARDLFENLHNLMEPTLEQKHIELDIILKDTDLQLEIDVNLVEQVLINLVVNAIDAVKDKEKPEIILTAVQNPGARKPVIKVADNGPGMEEDLLDKIFIPFFSTKKTGSGIGLSLCKQIMMLHKGNITVQSVVGEGTVFTLQF
ncbi:MAG: sensor histidine kinase [Ilyomonas sp.]